MRTNRPPIPQNSRGYSVNFIARVKQADRQLLGVRLGRACLKHDIPVMWVAGRIGVSRQAVYRWFTGDSTPERYQAEVQHLLDLIRLRNGRP